MSTKAYPLTHLIHLSFPTKLHHSHSHSHSLSFRHRCSSSHKGFHHNREFLSRRSFIPPRKGLMGERVFKIPGLRSGDGEENVRVLEQESLVDGSSQSPPSILSTDFETTLNRLSKWLVSGIMGAVILWRHDAEAVWVAMGSVLNSVLSVILKRILNQERPVSNRRSDPGMPSSHAQSIMFATVFVILSMVEWLGLNEYTLIFAAVFLAFGSYLSWLRVAQKYHTVNQVAVGAVLGSCVSLLWVWSWDAVVSVAFNSFFWVRVSVLLASAICCLGFLAYVVLNWFTDER